MIIITAFLSAEENSNNLHNNNYSPALGCSNSIWLTPAVAPLLALLLEPLTVPAAVGLGWEEEGEEMEVGFSGFLTRLSFLLQYVSRYSCEMDSFRCDVKNRERQRDIVHKNMYCTVLYCTMGKRPVHHKKNTHTLLIDRRVEKWDGYGDDACDDPEDTTKVEVVNVAHQILHNPWSRVLSICLGARELISRWLGRLGWIHLVIWIFHLGWTGYWILIECIWLWRVVDLSMVLGLYKEIRREGLKERKM